METEDDQYAKELEMNALYQEGGPEALAKMYNYSVDKFNGVYKLIWSNLDNVWNNGRDRRSSFFTKRAFLRF